MYKRQNEHGFRVELDINFDHPLIGRQGVAYNVNPDTFRRELASARTFGFMRDVAKLWSAGYALGASFENTLVVNESRLLNTEGLRYADEFARHKALDAIGDLALAGAPLLGTYRSVCGGHKLNHAVLTALMADTSAWMLVDGPETFRRELARARTFGFMRDVAKLWSAGYALGASFDNTLVVNDDRLLNPDGLRFPDEFARHKALDAIGDLALAGAPLLGAYRSVRGGHKLNHAVLSALMADPSAWVLVEGPELRPEIRPESRQEAPRRVVRGHAEVAGGLVAPVYGPDVS